MPRAHVTDACTPRIAPPRRGRSPVGGGGSVAPTTLRVRSLLTVSQDRVVGVLLENASGERKIAVFFGDSRLLALALMHLRTTRTKWVRIS